ncbi:MAG TPA: efflux RND transporter periplasmic adaptor subunit [Thermoanaerobaculia bacterium]|nr:efflux RND transporter periplasmic adaptor subunit [Thermoanaerobaculia bacterium]
MLRALALLLLLPLLGCAGAGAQTGAAAGEHPGDRGDLIVRRGDLRPRLVLTGELAAERAVPLIVPSTSSWQLQIRWMEKDGTPVAAGQKLVELDNSQFTSDLEEKRSTATQTAADLERDQAEGAAATAEKTFAVEQKKADLAKARLAAAVPQELLSRYEYQSRQLAVRRAEAELTKAEADLAAQRKASAADLDVRRLDLAKTEREIRAAEGAIAALVLTAPRAGIVLVGEHPWEGRKLHEGDNVWIGLPVMSLPDLASLVVDAALSDVDDGRVRPGMAAVCTLDAYPGTSFPARVAAVAPVARESARSSLLRAFKVRLRLDRVDAARMRPGMSVKVEVLGPETRDAVLAPRAGLEWTADSAGDAARARLAAGGTAPVRLGDCDATACVVLSGLTPGTRLRPAPEGREREAG